MTTTPATATVLSDADLERLELDVRGNLIGAVSTLARLRDGDAHLRRGFTSWPAYVLDRFGDLLAELAWTGQDDRVRERQELVLAMRTAERPASLRSIAAKLGVGLGTISADVADLRRAGRLDAEPAKVTGSDGVQRPARGTTRPTGGPLPAPAGRVYHQAAEWLHRAAEGLLPGYPGGLTLVELARVAGWTEGKASGALSYLRDPSRGLAVRLDDARLGQRVHALTPAGRVMLADLAAARPAGETAAVEAELVSAGG